MHSKNLKKALVKRATESVGILLTLLLVFSAIVYAITWVPGGPPQAAPGAGNVELSWTNDGTNVYRVGGNVGIGDATPDAGLKLDVEGRIGATEYCDEDGNNCTAAGDLGGGGGGGLTGAHTSCSWTGWTSCAAWQTSSSIVCPVNTFAAGYQRRGCSSGSCGDSSRCEQARLYCCN